NGAIRLHDADGKLLHTFEKTVWTHLAFSPDSKWLLVDGWQLFDLLKKEQRLLPTKPPYTGTHPSYGDFSSDSKTIATAAMHKEGQNWIIVRDAQTGAVHSQVIGQGMFPGWRTDELRWSKDGTSVCWRDAKVTELAAKDPLRENPDLHQPATFDLVKLEL